jgi:copper transport protein
MSVRLQLSPRFARTIVTTVLLGICLVFSAPGAEAHARLTDSSPAAGAALQAAPTALSLHFSEKVDAAFSRAQLFAADGSVIAIQPLAVDPQNPNTAVVGLSNPSSITTGVSTLVWRVLSATDGHVTTGTLSFSVGTGQSVKGSSEGTSTRPPWWRVAARWLELFPMLILAGFFPFILATVGRGFQSEPLYRTLMDRWRALWRATAALFLAGLVLRLWDQGLLATGASPSHPPTLDVYWRILSQSTFGTTWLLRGWALLVLAVLVELVFRSRQHWRAIALLGVVTGGGLLLTLPFSGHAAAEANRYSAIINDWVHLVAASIWVGGLAYLLVALVLLGQSHRPGMLASSFVTRFSRVAIVAVLLIVVAGAVMPRFTFPGRAPFGTRTTVRSSSSRCCWSLLR